MEKTLQPAYFLEIAFLFLFLSSEMPNIATNKLFTSTF